MHLLRRVFVLNYRTSVQKVQIFLRKKQTVFSDKQPSLCLCPSVSLSRSSCPIHRESICSHLQTWSQRCSFSKPTSSTSCPGCMAEVQGKVGERRGGGFLAPPTPPPSCRLPPFDGVITAACITRVSAGGARPQSRSPGRRLLSGGGGQAWLPDQSFQTLDWECWEGGLHLE